MSPTLCFTWTRYVTQLAALDTTLQPFEWEVTPLSCSLTLYETPLDTEYVCFSVPAHRIRVFTQYETMMRQSSDEGIEITSAHTCEYERPLVRLPRRTAKSRKSVTELIPSTRCLVWRAERTPTAAQRAMFCAKLVQYSGALRAVLVSHNSG